MLDASMSCYYLSLQQQAYLSLLLSGQSTVILSDHSTPSYHCRAGTQSFSLTIRLHHIIAELGHMHPLCTVFMCIICIKFPLCRCFGICQHCSNHNESGHRCSSGISASGKFAGQPGHHDVPAVWWIPAEPRSSSMVLHMDR